MGKLAALLDKSILAKAESGREVTKRDLKLSGPVPSGEFRRIMNLPAREPGKDDPELTSLMNRWLAREWPLPVCNCDTKTAIHDPACGGVSLRHSQARAIAEAVEEKGALIALPVGEGKTLTAILLASAFEKEHGIHRAVITCPSGLVKSFKRAIATARRWWLVQHGLEDRVVGYGKLSRVGSEELLERMTPGIIISDEAQELAGRGSARNKRFARLFKTFPNTKFVPLSGTIVKKDPRDFWQLIRTALGDERAPVPRGWPEMSQWAAAMGEDSILPAGCLSQLGDPGDDPTEAFGKRVLRTPGVVSTRGANVGASIRCRILKPDIPTSLANAVKSVESAWEIPDGHVIADASGMHRAVSQLSLGFYSKLVFPPESDREQWYEARRNWARFVRESGRKWTLKLDSELAVANAVDGGRLQDPENTLVKWRSAKASVSPENVTVWLDKEYAPRYVEAWRKEGGGLIWTHWVPAGELIAAALGVNWFGAGADPEAGDRFDCAVLSVNANHKGRNLQWLNRNLLLTMTPAADILQQLLGRTHRQGQTKDTVFVDFFAPTGLARDKLEAARSLAPRLAKLTGEAQKLSVADWEE